MRFFVMSLFFLNAVLAHAGTVTTREASLKVNTTKENWLVVQYCVEDRCVTLGREVGYTQEDWAQITRICEAKSYGEPNAEDIISQIAIISTYFAGGPALGMISMGAMGSGMPQATRDEMAQTVKYEPFLRNSVISLHLDPDQVIAIRNGLISCMNRFDRSPELWLESCNRNLNCKQNYLGKGLNWGSKQNLLKADPWVLLNAQQELRRAQEAATATRLQALD